MKIFQIFSRIPFQKTIAATLVMMILISQTIHVDFFDPVSAGPENYRDIVSIIVDRDTYQQERNRIKTYAGDIAGYLGGVRTSILVVEANTPVAAIAQKNEKLYYEGDGDTGASALIGTVFIGNIPIPEVTKEGQKFLSLYPYLDFDDKVFTYDPTNSQYRYNNRDPKVEQVDIWHGVINPSVGRPWEGALDISKIGQFLDKTHEFYTKSGKFAISNIPPKVFYYDGFSESKSINARSLFQYSLSMKNAENIAYNRFTKYLLKDISNALRVFDAQNEDPDVASTYTSLGLPSGSDTVSDDQAQKIPDIQTKEIILGFLKNFKGIFNEKSLGEELLSVHNAGRYNSGSTVRADLIPISISLMDDIARSTLKASNQALSASIDQYLQGVSSKIALLDKTTSSQVGNISSTNILDRTSYNKEYRNYYFGTPADTITRPEQCTIARGYSGDISEYGRSVSVEANAAFDINSTQGHINLLKTDTEELVKLQKLSSYSCFDPSTSQAKLDSYWGGNSILSVTNKKNSGSPDDFLFGTSPISAFTGFSLPIFSLGGMKESSRITTPSIANCINSKYQYTLLQPYKYTYTVDYGVDASQTQLCTAGWPDEWNRPAGYCGQDIGNRTPRFTCNTTHIVGTGSSISESLRDYTTGNCLSGELWVDGKALKKATKTCIVSTPGTESIDGSTIDTTLYENRYYHTIPSIWSHTSPTDSEILAAEANKVTPSLAIDQIRFVEFLTPKGNIARINYPNFFELQGSDIMSGRAWIKSQSNIAWQAIIDRENATTISQEQIDLNSMSSPGVLPNNPVDWNIYISDDMLTKILQSRNWLNPDISRKYKSSIETMLSYSRGSLGQQFPLKTPPSIPSLSDEYEIAYLGLPQSFATDFSQASYSTSLESYRSQLREIEGANISDASIASDILESNNPATDCGPPDGVSLLQWPSAILCWIKSQFPPRILAGSCGPSTIGIGSPDMSSAISPPSSAIVDTSALTLFYTGSRVIPYMVRSSMGLRDTLSLSLSLQKNNTELTLSPSSMAQIDIISARSPDGKKINNTDISKYITIAPEVVPIGEKPPQFLITSLGTELVVSLRATYKIRLPDGSDTIIQSAPVDITITPEYYTLLLEQSGSSIASIDVTSGDPVSLRMNKIIRDGSNIPPTGPINISLYDDLDSRLILTGSTDNTATYILPVDITKKVGVYRIIVTDVSGVMGEMTFSVRSGKLSQVRITPISSALVKGERTLTMVRLLDRLGNPISPDLHTISIDVSGGYIIDPSGQKQTGMTLDIMESQIPILIGSDTAGTVNINLTISDTPIVGTQSIKVYDSARIVLLRDLNPRVGGTPINATIEIQDASGKKIPGISSVASWGLPDGAGSFSRETLEIVDGSAKAFSYIPGTVSGNHSLSLDIPGIGSISNIVFSVLPGDPMYISHSVENDAIVFSLRDRYANIANTSLIASMYYGTDPVESITFVGGVYRAPYRPGYYTIAIPAMDQYAILYRDSRGEHRIAAMTQYAAYISPQSETINFAPDYNARYTILAGGSLLREAEDILYNTLPGVSQSLAVSTILEDPYRKGILASLYPGGSYELGQSGGDSLIESDVTLSNGLPLLTLSDIVSHRQIARVLYPMLGSRLDICRTSATETCRTRATRPTIRMILPKESLLTSRNNQAGKSVLISDTQEILSVSSDGTITHSPSISLRARDTATLGLEIDVLQGGVIIATLIYMMDGSLSVSRSPLLTSSTLRNTPLILSSGYSIEPSRGDPMTPDAIGYHITRPPENRELDEVREGPAHTDSLGTLPDISGVGWTGNNTMLLAYAGGDTVGESTRFFHTYTMINMGDPVAHVEHGRIGTQREGIDRSIGSIIARSTRSGIAQYAHRDMDADGIDDIIIVYQDGYIELLLNRGGKFRSRGMIAYNRDIDSQHIYFADFTNDGYSDTVGLDKYGSLILIDNSSRRIARRDISIDASAILPRRISQLRIHDMDADGRDDIIYITSGGELGILYGTAVVGNFTKKILDPTLGITLSPTPTTLGGAIKTNKTLSIQGQLGVSPVESTTLDESMLQSEVYYQYSHPLISSSTDTDDISGISTRFDTIADGATGNRVSTFMRSQYAIADGLDISKVYTNSTSTTLYAGDTIMASIRIKNNTNQVLNTTEYLDTIPKIFSTEKTQKYTVSRGSNLVSRDYASIGDSEYDAHFVIGNIAPGETVILSYDMIALSASYGEMVVGDLERGTVGSDAYGDVGFRTSTTCGATMLLWTSGPLARDYTRGTHEFGSVSLPDGLATRLADTDNNSIPDTMDSTTIDGIRTPNMSIDERQTILDDMTRSHDPNKTTSLITASRNGDQITLGFDSSAVSSIVDATQDLMDGLSCGFGGGGCLNSPLNWAPLAPGSVPSLFGIPLGLLTPSTGMPLFSGITGIPVYGPWGCIPMPATYPPSPIGFSNTCTANIPSAGGYLGTWDPTNFIRIYVTPTLTLGVGTAICFGGTSIVSGNIPPPALSPLVPGGNCIVVAKSLPICKGDGSSGDGDVTAISGLGGVAGDSWNASSCRPQANTITEIENQKLTIDIVSYIKIPNPNKLTSIYTDMSRRGPRSSSVGPLLTLGGGASGGTEVSIEIDSNTKISDIGSVIKVKNKRVAAFPDFLMDWLTRQTDEITTSLFTPPSLTVIPPTSFGQNAQVDSSYADFSEKIGASFSSANFENMRQGMQSAYNNAPSNTSGVPSSLQSSVQTTKGTLNAMKSAYSFIGRLPFVSIKQVNIPINIPWFDKGELDKYSRALDGYKREIDNAMKNFCINDPSPACLDQKVKFQNGAFVSSINQNLKRIEEYKKLPLKIQKYITWKERYIAQILCNIDSIQQITGGWLRDNGIRFRKWAELFVLIKAIAESWQPLLDLFADTTASCGVCRNERNNLQYWKFKLLSMLIPSIPVIKFPKWPDIVLDLSDIRLGINVSMPNFIPRISPIRLPSLPSLSIGSLSASLKLPGFPILPGLPTLPDLPDLPSLPRIKLPDLPPPPKIPKIAGSITGFLKIMKLISKMYCLYQKTVLVPEWQAGDVIAQRTERQGTLPFDFINLSLPQFSLPSLREIRVSSHVNYELRSDFISEFARSAVRPINEFQTDLQSTIPNSIGTDVSVPSISIDVKPGAYTPTDLDTTLPSRLSKIVEDIDRDKNIFFSITEFARYLTAQLDAPEFREASTYLQRGLRISQIEAEQLQDELTRYNDERFSLMREYLSHENNSNAALQNIIDLISHDIPGDPRQLIADSLPLSNRSTGLLTRLDQFQDPNVGGHTPPVSSSNGFDQIRNSLSARISRMTAATSLGQTTSSTPSIAAGYSPNYQGIYIKTPSGTQTRLFDYISPVIPDTRVDTVDIDQDGDLDYIYLLDGTLYIKYNWTNTPNKIIDTVTKISSISQDDLVPYVPDYFYEDVSTPRNLNYSFVSSSPTEREWRVEFYDQYTQWDRVDIGSHDPRISPKTTIDMFLDSESVPLSSSTGIITHTVARSLRSVADTRSFVLEGRRIDIYTGAISLTLSPGRVLYTGDRSVTITYKNETTQNPKSQILEPHIGYEFSIPTEVYMTDGRLYLIGGKDNSRYTYSDDLIGLPILPGMRLYASDAGGVITDLTANRSLPLAGGATYITYSLGGRADHYNISLPYPDGYYYARLQNLTDGKLDRAGVTLLSPQATSDDGEPVIDLPTDIRLPIYTTRSYLLSDILTDLSPVGLTIDSDITTDTNNNTIFDDDFTTESSTVAISFSDIMFGSFTQPGRYNMVLRAIDTLGNTTTLPISVTAYTPLPQIQSVSSTGWVLGSISESLSGIPAHLFRVRPGEYPTIISSGSTLSSSIGTFATGSFFASPETIVLRKNQNIATITSKGVITPQSGYRTEVTPATSRDPMRILTIDQTGSISHIHTLSLPDDARLIDTSRTLASTGVLLTQISGLTRITPAGQADVSIPGGQYITDTNYRPLAAIGRDGNIYTLDPLVTLRYRSKDGYMTVEILRQGIVVAMVEYRIDFFYTMQ